MSSETTPPIYTGGKRPHSSSAMADQQPLKKRRVHHVLDHVQNRPVDIEPAPQDPVFSQGQLLKSIGAALAIAGFDSVKPTALEMFRSHVEEYMLRFLTHARTNMQDGRRTTPTALDFAFALASMPNASTASFLKAQLDLRIPQYVSCPKIPLPDPLPPPAPDFSNLLAPLIDQTTRAWIPKHFPSLPPSHAWEATADFPQREKDARKMREKSTEEGMLAEQALRKLAAAAKISVMNAEKRRNSVLSVEGRVRDVARSKRIGVRVYEDTFADVLKDIGGSDEITGLGLNGAAGVEKEGMDLGMPEGVMVNHDMSHWRKGASQRR